MRFMFFGPEVCLGLPSDSASPRTPLPPTTATAAFTAQDLHLVDNAHAGHTKKARPGGPALHFQQASAVYRVLQAILGRSTGWASSSSPAPLQEAEKSTCRFLPPQLRVR